MLARVMDGTAGTERVPYARVTVAEAAERLGVSVVTIRRMIKRGRLEAERVHRPQGSAYLVTLPAAGADGTRDGASTERPVQNGFRTQGTRGEQLAAWSETFLLPLVAALERSQATVRDQAETIGELRAEHRALERENGRLTAELTAERARSSTDASTAPESADPPPEPAGPFPAPLEPSTNGADTPNGVRLAGPGRPWWRSPLAWAGPPAPWLLAVLAIVAVVVIVAWRW
jgi:excisionase family DNA binding protein